MTIVDFDSGQVAEKIRRAAGNTVAGHALRQADASSLRDRYRENGAHYRAVAAECLERGDHLQAAEKSWGVFAQAVKEAGAAHRYRLRTHEAVIRVAHALTEMVGPSDPARAARLRHGLTAARSLHQHFYEGDLPPDLVRSLVAEVMDAVDLLDTAFSHER